MPAKPRIIIAHVEGSGTAAATVSDHAPGVIAAPALKPTPFVISENSPA